LIAVLLGRQELVLIGLHDVAQEARGIGLRIAVFQVCRGLLFLSATRLLNRGDFVGANGPVRVCRWRTGLRHSRLWRRRCGGDTEGWPTGAVRHHLSAASAGKSK